MFVKNYLFEKIIKSCKATNLEFLKPKEKLGLCLYEDICDEQELISMSEETFKEEKVFIQPDVENKKLRKEESDKLRKEESENNVVKDATIKESIKIKSPEKDKNATDSYPNWFNKNKFNKILAIIDSDTFNCRHKIGEFRYTEIKDLVNKTRNNTISQISAKKDLNTLNELKNAEIIKYKKCTPKQKELLNLFNDLLDKILTDKTLESKSEEDDENENKNKNENENVNENENENVNENDETLMSSDKDDDDEIIKISMHSDEYAEKTDQNEKNTAIKKLLTF